MKEEATRPDKMRVVGSVPSVSLIFDPSFFFDFFRSVLIGGVKQFRGKLPGQSFLLRKKKGVVSDPEIRSRFLRLGLPLELL